MLGRARKLHAKYNKSQVQAGSNTQTLSYELAALFREAAAAEEASAEADLESIPARIEDLSRRLVALDRRLPIVARRLGELRRLSETELARRAADELRRVRSVYGVQQAGIEDSALIVLTEPIVVAARALGAYRISIKLGGDIRIESVNHGGPRPAWDHPHVQDGLPCLGNLRPGVLKLIAELELGLTVQVLLDFLRSYQAETAYTPIEGWPIA
jgi:hypothetical protein